MHSIWLCLCVHVYFGYRIILCMECLFFLFILFMFLIAELSKCMVRHVFVAMLHSLHVCVCGNTHQICKKVKEEEKKYGKHIRTFGNFFSLIESLLIFRVACFGRQSSHNNKHIIPNESERKKNPKCESNVRTKCNSKMTLGLMQSS